ncbi:TetR/AcrR family transcriptional regulator [Amycolatopsis taiwanensis]|uniref:TetR family transcriptional regulator n=1 Tax=Amycolatopsis taiwanensis TaxID=342230 RepID=A0A9W6QVC7_9PSEU|nr:TetR/AcrR family transcriptional regulator [Amycolatopsis taiwanensis]GLY64259.1 TetR family transcriptional regulator [Amycolatopsis taiwanensis]
MPELTAPRRRRRRTDAERSANAILHAAVEILATQPNASVEDIATAAGVSRQTVYAHFKTREALINAVIDAITREAVAEMDAARLDEGPAAEALLRLLDASWRTLRRYPLILGVATQSADAEADHHRHRAVADHLDRVLTRGRQSGEFAGDLNARWLGTAIISLGHAAGDAVRTEQLPLDEATTALARSVLRICGVNPRTITKLVDATPR